MSIKIAGVLLAVAGLVLSYRPVLEQINKPLAYVAVAVALSINVAVPYLIEKGVIIRLKGGR